jgi:hypothetical protein
VALYHTAGPPAADREPAPAVTTDVFTTWASVGQDLKSFLRLDGSRIGCVEY